MAIGAEQQGADEFSSGSSALKSRRPSFDFTKIMLSDSHRGFAPPKSKTKAKFSGFASDACSVVDE